MNISDTIQWFNSVFEINRNPEDTKKNFFCGVTDDVEKIKNERSVENLLGVSKCDNVETAQKLKKRMGDEGYDIDDNDCVAPDYVYVYLYKKNV